MFPLLLHLGVHHEEGVVREVDGYLAFCVCTFLWGVWVEVGFGRGGASDDLADSEFARYAEGETADCGAGA